jgi:hypothetical protein
MLAAYLRRPHRLLCKCSRPILPSCWRGPSCHSWGVLLTALICGFLADLFDPFAFTFSVGLPQDLLVFTSLAATGL